MENEERGFLAENWPWIVVPFFLVVGLLGALMFITGDSGGDDEAAGEFVYNVF